jgi:cyclopropane fatty-acyl-phospholipid synthase-like methyltransferase
MAPSLTRPDFPRSNHYDLDWIIDGSLGPHPLWLAESLTHLMELRPGMRVLDLGCGKALTSVLLAREPHTILP